MPDLSTGTTGSAANPISLADVLSLRVPVHWTEAVAAVEELCLVLASWGNGALVPPPADVLITAHGAVMIRRGAEGVPDVDGIGRMLNALLDPVTTPIPLRLFVAHSIGSEKFKTVQAYAEALAYYARPDRTELIQALYRRCLEVPVAPLPPLAQKPRAEQTPPPEPAAAAPPVSPRRIQPWLRVAAALMLLALCSAFIVWRAGRSTRVMHVRNSITAMASQVVEAVGHFVSSEDTASDSATGSPDSGDPRPTRTARARLRASADQPSTPAVGDSAGATLDASPVVLAPLEAGTVADGGLALAPGASAAPDTSRFYDPGVYSSASAGVQPPVMYSPMLPPVLPSDTEDSINTMELLIDETGTVKQARLVSRPKRMSDMMLLSPAKTWRFHPALKDGRPVKYRLTVSWAVTPP